jgi:hypothetical protein
LRAGRHTPLDGQVGQELFHFRRPQVARVARAMVEDEAFDPLHVTIFRAPGITAHAHHLTNLIEQARRPGLRQFPNGQEEHGIVQKLQGGAGDRAGRQGILLSANHSFQETADCGQVEFLRVPFAMKQDEPRDPGHEARDHRFTMAGGTRGGTELVEKPRR